MMVDKAPSAQGSTSEEDAATSRSLPRFGGFPIEDATRHLSNFYAGAKPDERTVTFFRTTRALVVAARRWRKLANDKVRSVGQSMARWETMYLLACARDDLSQRELAQLIGVEGPTMAHMLNTLERDGLIERAQSQVDRRVVHNRITEKGLAATRDIMAITNDLRADILRDIPPEKLAIALEVLEQVHARLDDYC
ncbi:MarR family transcriptional regulator for hemolysin [Sphingobium sp. B8D3C]|uniref:MarR family winged helix-turn-helix transcriptional regulator n=2 Tax=Sphingobium TaxID=165695 RepID=UPI00222452F9|nr:MarR family winged helix-turn-helix transcriptional regulator [Sphingobium sp. B8D3D]MCW2395626.1 MarR family transcriptional regulator for hemolysin [Sphingobium sp. B8D3B]MCW2414481.1 MarR family transcriptional regulator for hemolysin [Sphingobium sp. B8D3A]MCW2419141.1 MarR family transcriptional regulator for hemolysin [Sphingobium sp. B8D3C]